MVAHSDKKSMTLKPNTEEVKKDFLSVALFDLVVDLFVEFLQKEHKSEFDCSTNLCDISVHLAHQDLRKPHEWFPKARQIKRKIIYHYGPTNSGKTMTSLQSLLKAKKGVYCAPLRMLAWEIFEKISKTGKKASLLTGEERKVNEDAEVMSCTIEMLNLEVEYDIAVIVLAAHAGRDPADQRLQARKRLVQRGAWPLRQRNPPLRRRASAAPHRAHVSLHRRPGRLQ